MHDQDDNKWREWRRYLVGGLDGSIASGVNLHTAWGPGAAVVQLHRPFTAAGGCVVSQPPLFYSHSSVLFSDTAPSYMSSLPRVTSIADESQAAAKCTSDLSNLHAAMAPRHSESRHMRMKSIAISNPALEAEMDSSVPLGTRKELAAERALFTTFR